MGAGRLESVRRLEGAREGEVLGENRQRNVNVLFSGKELKLRNAH